MSKDKKTLLSELTTKNLVILGLVLILLGNVIDLQILHVKLHEILANIGALFLFVGTLQWVVDEDSRIELVSKLTDAIRNYLERRDRLTDAGISDCILDSKALANHEVDEVLIKSAKFAIGIQYSDGAIVRFEKVIRERIAINKTTQIAHSDVNGVGAQYISNSLTPIVDLPKRIEQLHHVLKSKFGADNKFIHTIPHGRVLHYSFVYSDYSIWIIFMTCTDGYVPQIPALRISAGSPLFDFFKEDIQRLGVSV